MEIDTYYYSATRILQVMQEGKNGARLCECDDGNKYVIKTLSEMPPYELIAEWICGHLAIAFGLPVPPCKLVIGIPKLIRQGGDICNEDDNLAGFASLFQPTSQTLLMHASVSVDQKLKTDILVFDAWVKNGDRNLSEQGGNVNLLQDMLNPLQLWVFDHNLALKPDQDMRKLATHHVFCGENAGVGLDDIITRVEYETRIQRCMEQLPQIIATIPDEWIEGANDSRNDGKDVINDIIYPILNRYNDPDFWNWITP
ncbi:HipA family kinase [Aeromonas dhakensis]|uniref:HipA family kinase n=1 Tax=Aeromonas dhakensis TaxID=196024 RepID=UPI003EC7C15C